MCVPGLRFNPMGAPFQARRAFMCPKNMVELWHDFDGLRALERHPLTSQMMKTPITAPMMPAFLTLPAGCSITFAIIFFMASGNNA